MIMKRVEAMQSPKFITTTRPIIPEGSTSNPPTTNYPGRMYS